MNATFAATAERTFTELHTELDTSLKKLMPSLLIPVAHTGVVVAPVAIVKWIAMNILTDILYFRAGMLVVSYSFLKNYKTIFTFKF